MNYNIRLVMKIGHAPAEDNQEKHMNHFISMIEDRSPDQVIIHMES